MAMSRTCDTCDYALEIKPDVITCDCEESDYYDQDVEPTHRCDCYKEA